MSVQISTVLLIASRQLEANVGVKRGEEMIQYNVPFDEELF